MLALFNLSGTEVVLVVVVAVLVFGRRLPEVAGQAAGVVQRVRRSIADLRRETGIDREIEEARRKLDEARREVTELRRGIEHSVPRTIEVAEAKPPVAPRAEPAPSSSSPEAAKQPESSPS